MRNGFRRINCIFHFIGGLLLILGLILLFPLIIVIAYWGQMGEGWNTAVAFLKTALNTYFFGIFLITFFNTENHEKTRGMHNLIFIGICITQSV